MIRIKRAFFGYIYICNICFNAVKNSNDSDSVHLFTCFTLQAIGGIETKSSMKLKRHCKEGVDRD